MCHHIQSNTWWGKQKDHDCASIMNRVSSNWKYWLAFYLCKIEETQNGRKEDRCGNTSLRIILWTYIWNIITLATSSMFVLPFCYIIPWYCIIAIGFMYNPFALKVLLYILRGIFINLVWRRSLNFCYWIGSQ